MEKLIRNSVYETNSSSTHCITIADKDDLLDTVVPDDNGIITLTCDNEFGWEWEKYNDPMIKMNYLFVYIMDHCGLYSYQDMCNLRPEGYDDLGYGEERRKLDREVTLKCFHKYVEPSKFWKKFKKTILNHTGATDLKFNLQNGDYYEYGYIDHQSVEDNNYHFLFEDLDEMKRFIFSPKSWLCTGNDNSENSWDVDPKTGEPMLSSSGGGFWF